jgi:hypothetical protein
VCRKCKLEELKLLRKSGDVVGEVPAKRNVRRKEVWRDVADFVVMHEPRRSRGVCQAWIQRGLGELIVFHSLRSLQDGQDVVEVALGVRFVSEPLVDLPNTIHDELVVITSWIEKFHDSISSFYTLHRDLLLPVVKRAHKLDFLYFAVRIDPNELVVPLLHYLQVNRP